MEILIILFMAFFVFMIGRLLKDYPLVSFSGMILMLSGIYLIRQGIQDIRIWFSSTLGLVILAIGLYVFLRSPYETYKKDKFKPGEFKKFIKGIKRLWRK